MKKFIWSNLILPCIKMFPKTFSHLLVFTNKFYRIWLFEINFLEKTFPKRYLDLLCHENWANGEFLIFKNHDQDFTKFFQRYRYRFQSLDLFLCLIWTSWVEFQKSWDLFVIIIWIHENSNYFFFHLQVISIQDVRWKTKID